MNFLLRLTGSYVDAVLKSCYPLEREPSMADLEAEALADKEAEEEVAEPNSGFGYWHAPEPEWPEEPDPLSHLVAIVEDIRNILQSSAVPSAESPGEVVPPTSPGYPNLDDPLFWRSDLAGAAQALLCMANGSRRKAKGDDYRLQALAQRLQEISAAIK